MSHQITRITLYPFSIPLKHPFQIATLTSTHAEGVFLRLETESGYVGWGEATPLHSINGETQETIIATLKNILPNPIFQPFGFQSIIEATQVIAPGQNAAVSAIDIALHDLSAQIAGLPLNQFLGESHDRFATDMTIGICPPYVAKRRAKEIEFNSIKVKVGEYYSDYIDDDIKRIAAVREAAGPHVNIRIDANQAFTAPKALEFLNQVEEYDIEFCEQPTTRFDYEGLKWLHQRSPIPVMADESCFSPQDAARLAKEEVCKLINIKLSKSGGITTAKQIADVCAAHHINCMIGGMVETRLGVTAATHFAAYRRNIHYYDLDAHIGHKIDPIEGGVTYQAPFVHLPKTPGLGAKPSENFLKSLAPIEIN